MSSPVQPGEVGRLPDDGLASAGEYTALAAVASRAGGERALQLLSEHCDNPIAFAWWWALAVQNADRLASAGQLAAKLTVPDALADEVAAHVRAKLTQRELQYRLPVTTSRAEILSRLDGTAPWAGTLAHEVVTDPDDRSPEVIAAALHILGGSRDPKDRAAVLDFAGTQPYAKRGGILVQLSDPISADEARQVVEAIVDMRGRGADRTEWEPVARLLSRLPVEVAAEFLAGPFSHGTGRGPLLDAGLVGKLGVARLRGLLTTLESPAIVADLLQRAARDLPQAALAEFSAWAHGQYTAAACAGFRERLAEELRGSSFSRGVERRQQALEGLWSSALAGRTADAVADELVAAADPAELAARATGVDNGRAAGQLGAAAAKMLAARQPTEMADHDKHVEAVAGAVRALRADLVAHLAAGLMRAAIDTPAMMKLRGGLLDALLEHPDAITAFAAEGGTDVLTAHGARTPTHATAVLLGARAQLSAEQAATLLGAQPEHPQPRRSYDPPAPPSPTGVDWMTVDSATYLQVLEVASTWPEAIFSVLSRALAALDEPEARQPSADVLRAVLTHAEENGLASQLGEATTEHVHRLLRQRNGEVLRAACRWIRRLDVDSGASGSDVDRAHLVLRADTSRGGRQADLSVLRTDLANRHAQLAQDLSLASDMRVTHLQTAASLGAGAARAAALPLAESPTITIRLAAARVLAETPGSQDEHATLIDLAAGEDDAEVANLLQTALHRLTSGDIGEALRNLAELLGLSPTGLDPDALVPDPRHRERFVMWVDTARARSGNAGDPGSFIEAAINVIDQMVDLAVIAGFDAGLNVGFRANQVDGIRANDKPRPDAGALVNQQQCVQLFGWFHSVAALRAKRAAHPSPRGSTEPPRFEPEDLVVARGLLRAVTEGWIADMHAHARPSGDLT